MLMVSRDLTEVLNDQYANEPETQAYLDRLHALSSLSGSWSSGFTEQDYLVLHSATHLVQTAGAYDSQCYLCD